MGTWRRRAEEALRRRTKRSAWSGMACHKCVQESPQPSFEAVRAGGCRRREYGDIAADGRSEGLADWLTAELTFRKAERNGTEPDESCACLGPVSLLTGRS